MNHLTAAHARSMRIEDQILNGNHSDAYELIRSSNKLTCAILAISLLQTGTHPNDIEHIFTRALIDKA